jgi:TnpA family transposase
LSEDQVLRYRRFVDDPSPGELELFFRMDAVTVARVKSKRRSHNRLGWSVQWGTIRMLGTVLSTPVEVPDVVIRFVAEQLDIDDPSCLKLYPDRLPTQHEHAREIRELLGYRDFDEGELELRSYVASRVWNSVESRRALFDRAVVWLLRNRVLLPGISVLSRLVTEVRAGEYERIYGLIAAASPSVLTEKLIGLLEVPAGGHVSELERMRRTVHSISGQGLKLALGRVSDVCELKAGEVDLARIPLVKQVELARYGMASKAPTIRGLTPERRTSTMLATVRHLEGAAVDDALLLFDALMTTKLLARAERLSTSEKLRTLPRFRKAAGVVADVLAALKDVAEADAELAAQAEADGVAVERVLLAQAWEQIEQVASREALAKALATVVELVPDADEDDDVEWRAQLVARYPTVRGVLEPLATVIPWGATEAGEPVVAALRALPSVLARRPPGAEHVAEEMVTGSWRRLVYGNPDLPAPQIDRSAYTFCVLEALWRALRRRDVYAHGAGRWGDPRARLLDDTAWGVARPRVLTALGLPADPAEHLDELARDLDAAYRQVADGLPANTAVRIAGGRIELDRLGPEPEPPGTQAVRDAVSGMLPRIDYPELILEVNARTGMFDGFTHITGTDARLEDLDISLAGVLVSESCNVGLVPVIKKGVKALTRGRLLGVDRAYFRAECIGGASAILVASQAGIDIAGDWGGGMVASADGMRFVVPVRSLHARPNPKYFGLSKRRTGATWLNVISDRIMGLGGVVVPGTVRDSLYILDAIHNLDALDRPEQVITDTASYSDIVFGLFAICGYQFSPRIADIGDTRLWRMPAERGPRPGYGKVDDLARHTIKLSAVRARWDDMLRVAGSLVTGKVRAYDLIRMMSADGRTTGLGEAFAHYGRIFKTLHVLQFLHDETYRRTINTQLNMTESRHALARRIFFGNLGELRQKYMTGMEDQLGALGLGLNCVTWWNTLYIDAAVKELEAAGMSISTEIRARLTPLQFDHINFNGRYPIARPDLTGALRPLRDPGTEEEDG